MISEQKYRAFQARSRERWERRCREELQDEIRARFGILIDRPPLPWYRRWFASIAKVFA